MSAALVILPRVWATADASFVGGQRLSIAPPAGQPATPAQDPFARKGPRSLRLVAAQAEPQPQAAVQVAAQATVQSTVKVTVQATVQATVQREAQPQPVKPTPAPELAFYRKYTEAMLQRYLRLSLEAGRVPSLMGRELFRGDVSHCTMQGFDDAVIFVHDVGNCIARLTPGKQHLVRRIALQGYSHGETAAMLGICHKTVSRHYASALDQLTAMLIRGKLLQLQEEALQSA